METLEVGKRFDPLAGFVSKVALVSSSSPEIDDDDETSVDYAPNRIILEEDFSDFEIAEPELSTEIEVYRAQPVPVLGATCAQFLEELDTQSPSKLPGAPSSLEREELEVWARSYCRALCEKYQSQRLFFKLFGRPENPDGGSLKFQVKAIPEKMEARRAWLSSAKLSFDKKVGA